MRQDPPFDMAYITATHLLERLHPATLVVNDPSHVRNAPEKLFVTDLAELHAADADHQRRAKDPRLSRPAPRHHSEAPLRRWRPGVFRLRQDDENLGALLEMFTLDLPRTRRLCSASFPSVPRATSGSSWWTARPQARSTACPQRAKRARTCVGGRAEPTTLTAREREICDAIGPELKRRGLIFAGIDVIGELSDRDERHLAHGHPGGEALRRPRRGDSLVGPDRSHSRRVKFLVCS